MPGPTAWKRDTGGALRPGDVVTLPLYLRDRPQQRDEAPIRGLGHLAGRDPGAHRHREMAVDVVCVRCAESW